MLTRIYKNNNFTVRRENGDEAADNLEMLVHIIAEYADDLMFDYFEPLNYGNSYAVMECEIWCNGAPRYYHIYPEMVERFNSGYVVRIEYREDVPLFIMPTFTGYASAVNTTTGQKGTIYYLEKMPDENVFDAMKSAGCEFITAQYRYAPEIKHPAVFVPNGVYFSFC